jgi:DNA modification methylase
MSKGGDRLLHPSQKPVPLMAWFLQNYSRPGDTVMDNTMGSGSTGVACVIEGRNFVGIEQDFDYYTLASGRIEEARAKEGVRHNFGTDSTGVLISRVVPEFTGQLGMDF